jgi:hypothetical protein
LLDSLFEHPAWLYPIARKIETLHCSPCLNSSSEDS